jgi:hypothetical protein
LDDGRNRRWDGASIGWGHECVVVGVETGKEFLEDIGVGGIEPTIDVVNLRVGDAANEVLHVDGGGVDGVERNVQSLGWL